MATAFDWNEMEGVIPRPEHPRPDFVRPHWKSLNGVWEFASDRERKGLSARWYEGRKLSGKVVVPFAYQTSLSGIDSKGVDEVVWYARNFDVPEEWLADGRDVLLHFGAVDYRCTVWVNGQEIGHHVGGHVSFFIDVAPVLKPGDNRICIRVEDTQDPYQPRGKQAVNGLSKGCDYYNTTGIWQSVWLESVSCMRVQNFRFTPHAGKDPAQDHVEALVYLHAPANDWRVRVEVLDGDHVVASTEEDAENATARLIVPLPHAKRWTPESPHLYDVRIQLRDGADVMDEVTTYLGVRSVSCRGGQFLLNGEPTYLKLVLDQGYWPESGMTPPSEEAIRADIEWCKRLGFNGARKHQKVEDPRWLYWCDKLGLLVWGEMANARAWSQTAEERFIAEWEEVVRRDANHPCIVTWVPINESWGVPELRQDNPVQIAFVERVVALTRRLDPSRPVVDNDGWEHTDVSDIIAIHDYTMPSEKLLARYEETLNGGPLPPQIWGGWGIPLFVKGAKYRGQPVMLTEVGGLLSIPAGVPKEKWDGLYSIYASSTTPEELVEQYRDLMQAIASLPFVSGFCYTQLTDIEQEINGLLGYDRVPKVDPEAVRAIHEAMGK
jgi:beta-galactosidase/beta-glucuronidase